MYCIPVRPGHEMLMCYFSCSGGPMAVFIKTCRDALRRTCVFASCGIYGSSSAFQSIRGVKRDHTIFHARVQSVRIRQKVCWDMLHRSCVFPSGGICRSRSAFRCIGGTKRNHTIFQAQVGPVQIRKKCVETRYT
jgi:hypothetical protein